MRCWRALALCLLLFGGNLFIWDFQVRATRPSRRRRFSGRWRSTASAVGSPGLHIDQEDLRNHVLLELPEVAWLAVNVRGCVAHVQVVERQRPPAAVTGAQSPTSWPGARGLSRRCRRWTAGRCAPGTAVTEGQLLISGVADTERSGAASAARHGEPCGPGRGTTSPSPYR